MEKNIPHYLLTAVQLQMTTIALMHLTVSARDGIRAAGLSQADALEVVKRLTKRNFYKSMTTHANHRIWQDVYHGWHSDIALYIKFQQAGDFFVVSFKEL